MGAGASTGGVPSASRLSGCKDSKFLWEHLARRVIVGRCGEVMLVFLISMWQS